MTTRGQEEKRYDPKDTTLKFVNRPDDLDPLRKHGWFHPHVGQKWLYHCDALIISVKSTKGMAGIWFQFCCCVQRPVFCFSTAPEDGDVCLRAEMSCGHAVTPESLTGWCRSLLDQVLSATLLTGLLSGTDRVPNCCCLCDYNIAQIKEKAFCQLIKLPFRLGSSLGFLCIVDTKRPLWASRHCLS